MISHCSSLLAVIYHHMPYLSEFFLITLHIKIEGQSLRVLGGQKPFPFLNAAVVPTPEPVLLFSICEIK